MLRLYRGTTTNHLSSDFTRVSPHKPRLEGWMMISPRIYFTTDFNEAQAYAVIEAVKTGGTPYVVEIDMAKVRGRLRRGTESEFIKDKDGWRTGEWYIEIGSWDILLPIVSKVIKINPNDEKRLRAMFGTDYRERN